MILLHYNIYPDSVILDGQSYPDLKSNQIHLFGRKQYIYLTEMSFDRCCIRPRRTDVAVNLYIDSNRLTFSNLGASKTGH